jgi:dTDP-glucose 4,6-dehydratase
MEDYIMKTYLVTGGAGFIGSNYIHYLMNHRQEAGCTSPRDQEEEDISIINLDCLTYCGNRSNVSCYEEYQNYRFLQGDICDEKLVKDIFAEENIDFVVHFAAETHVDRSIDSAIEFARTNVLGTLNLLNAANAAWRGEHRASHRFLYVSTDEVYGDLPNEGYFTEASPLRPRNPYAASKAGADMMVRAFYETHQLPILITRCSNNYGPYQYPEKFLPLCLKCCLQGKEIPIYGDGSNVRDWLCVEDHCRAIEAVLQKGCPGEVYNVGGHNELTNLEFVTIIRDILDREFHQEVSPIRFITDRKGHDRRYAIDSAKLQKELDWRPLTKFSEGIRETIGWYLEHKDFLRL